MSTLLEVAEASVTFGALKAVSGVSLNVGEGEVLGLIGPNGAGKSTLFNGLTGHVRLTSGNVKFGGVDLTHLPSHVRARAGIARTFQLGGIISDLTVGENLALGLDHGSRITGRRRRPGLLRTEVLEWLDRFELAELCDELGGSLSPGIRREVEILRAIASGAKLVLLDEPGVGLSAAEKRRLVATVRKCAADGKAFLITDHDTDVVFTISDRVMAMSFGCAIATGSPTEVRQHPTVVETYLGRGRSADD